MNRYKVICIKDDCIIIGNKDKGFVLTNIIPGEFSDKECDIDIKGFLELDDNALIL